MGTTRTRTRTSTSARPVVSRLEEGRPRKARVFVVDDHPLLREGSAALLGAQPDLEFCGAAADAAGALAGLAAARADVVVVDLNLEGRNGLELVKDLKARQPPLPVVVYTMYDENVYAERALRAGARGYVMKREPAANLLAAVRTVAGGGYHFSPVISTRLLDQFASGPPVPGDPLRALSDRELEVFDLLGQGLRPRAIAAKLRLSSKTVEFHLDSIKRKLRLRSASQILPQAISWRQRQHWGSGRTAPGAP